MKMAVVMSAGDQSSNNGIKHFFPHLDQMLKPVEIRIISS